MPEETMPETDPFLIRSGRFRTTRFPGAVGGRVAPSGNIEIPRVDPNVTATPGLESSLEEGGGETSGSDQFRNIEPLKAPSIGEIGAGVGKAVATGAATGAGSIVGAQTGRALSTGADFGTAFQSGVDELGSQVSGFGSKVSKFFGGGGPEGGASAGSSGGLGAPPTGSSPASSLEASAGSDATSAGFGAAGAGIGAGLFRTGVGLLTGEKPAQAVLGGAAVGIGTAIGYAVGGPVGGFVGGTIGGFFCPVEGTLVKMADGSWKKVEDVQIGDETELGGNVFASVRAQSADIYEYRGILIAGRHVVEEDGVWLRVRDSALAVPVSPSRAMCVYAIGTEKHRLVFPGIVAADTWGGEAELNREKPLAA